MLKKFILILIYTISIFSNEDKIKKFINFDHKTEKGEKLNPEDFSTYNELRRWANFQSLSLLPDNPKYGLKDGICRMIPTEGLEFYLTFDPNDKRKIFIYFDLTTYQNINQSQKGIRSLGIQINGKQVSKVIFDKDEVAKNPFVVSLDPSTAPSGRINILLLPDSNAVGRFWGIWDVFYSYSKE